MTDGVKNRGWTVTFAGTGINLALGILYTWSVIKKALPSEGPDAWTDTQKALPYMIACIVFALVMVPAGRMQDKVGPRWVALCSGIAVGVGLIIASLFPNVTGFVIGFGVLAGAGIGMGYASATPPAVKWFPSQKTGLIAGLVVGGFGLASVYISPLATFLIGKFGLQTSLLIFGIAFLVIVSALSQLLTNPPAGYKPVQPQAAQAAAAAAKPAKDYSIPEMLKTPQFYLLWLMFVFAAGAGLMIIANITSIVKIQANIGYGFIFVALFAVGNTGGRVIAGIMSDKIGRTLTMLIVFLAQAVIIFLLRYVTSVGPLYPVIILLGFNYGANLSLFPSITKDYYGLKNFGVNYGMVFTAWGVGGFALPLLAGKVFDGTKKAAVAVLEQGGMAHEEAIKAAVGNYNTAYLIAAGLLVVAAVLSLLVKSPHAKQA